MRILALDAATEACSVALLVTGRAPAACEVLIERNAAAGKTHANQVLSMVDSVLTEAQLALSDLDGIAASVGPGAFTGVRISVAVAQGLAFGSSLRVVPVMTLEALAWQAVRGGAAFVLACLDARMGEVYWGCFAADAVCGVTAATAARVGPPDSVRPPDPLPPAGYRGIGRGFAAYPALAEIPEVHVSPTDARALPGAGDMARLGALRLAAGEGRDPAHLCPMYLRDKVALTEAERGLAKAR